MPVASRRPSLPPAARLRRFRPSFELLEDRLAPAVDAVKTVVDVNGGELLPGDILEYTIQVTNHGGGTVTNLRLVDAIPANTSYVTGSLQVIAGANSGSKTDAAGDDQARFAAGDDEVIFNLGTGATATSGGILDVGASTSVRFRVRVDAGTANGTIIANTGSVRFVDASAANQTVETTEAAVSVVNQADLAITKVVSDNTPGVGDTVVFQITLTNNGPLATSNVQVTDLLPAGLTFVSADASQGTYNQNTGIWNVGTVENAASHTLVIVATVASLVDGINTASITASSLPDPVESNNSASTSIETTRIDLAVTKTVSNATPNVGDNVTYTITVTNNGPDGATNVRLTDLLPAGLTFVSANPSAGSYDQVTGLWTVGNLGNGASETLQIVVTVASAEAIFNAAVNAVADEFDFDPGNNFAGVSIRPQQADLSITKTVNDSTPSVGQNITYTITLANTGPSTATNIVVRDVLPGGVTYVSDTPSVGAFDEVTGLWTIPSLASGSTATLQITVQVNDVNAIVNTAEIEDADQFDPNLDNNEISLVVNPQQADLVIEKTVSNFRPNVGQVITFTITLRNIGAANATNVVVRDLLPSGLTFVSSTPSTGSYNQSTGIWTVGTVSANDSETLQITARAAGSTATTNTAVIVSADQPDPNLDNNTDSVVVTPQRSDLQVTKTVDNNRPAVGQNVTFTITVNNAGPDDATNVTVLDQLPTGLTFVSATSSPGTTYVEATGSWNIGNLATSSSVTLVIVATVTVDTTLVNTARVNSVDQFDPVTSNNSASVTISSSHADLEIDIRRAGGRAFLNRPVTLVIIVRNTGPDTATNVTVSNPFPAANGMRFLRAGTPSQGSYDFNSGTLVGTWTVGTLAAGATARLQIQAIVTQLGPATHSATASTAVFDPIQANNTDEVTLRAFLGSSTVSKRQFLASTPPPEGNGNGQARAALRSVGSKQTASLKQAAQSRAGQPKSLAKAPPADDSLDAATLQSIMDALEFAEKD